MNNRCATCKCWSPNTKPPDGLGCCYHVKVQNDWEDFSDGLKAQGFYEDSAVVHTGPDFGCIHWTPK